MKTYDKYKDSGIEWLGEIPEHWEVKRVKDIFMAIGSGTTPSTSNASYYENGQIPWLNTTDLNNGKVVDTSIKITKKALHDLNLKIYPVNSLAIAMYGQGKTRGTVGLIQIQFTTNQASCIMYKPYRLNTQFILYWFIHKYTDIRNLNIGATQPNMNQDFVRNLILNFPPLQEQTSIAQYLEAKTSTIDKKISLLEQKAKHYKELRKSIINEAVCRGLDKDVKLKDSGIEWIGEIPEHWEVRGKEIFKEISKKGYPSEPLLAASQKKGVVLKSMLDQRSMEAQKDFHNFKLVEVNDFVISLRSFEGGIETAYFKGIISPVYSVFRLKINGDTNFFKHLFKSERFILYLQSIVTGIRDGLSIKFVEVQNTYFALPKKEEQTVIARFLDEKAEWIDKIIINLIKQIEILKELRKTLINDVVTGKIKVYEGE